ncbi:ABC superfamily ATP binding cassette transporter, solute-binding protein, partial [human gut metagenome]
AEHVAQGQLPWNSLSRRRFAQISSLSLAAAVLAGCSGSSGSSGANTVTWSTWGSPEELKRYDAVQEQFKKDLPEVELVFQPPASFPDYHSKL